MPSVGSWAVGKSRWKPVRRIPEMNIPVPPFAKGGLVGIGFLPALQFGVSIPPPPPFAEGVGVFPKGGKHS